MSLLRRPWRRRSNWQWFQGEYESWASACAGASGYEDHGKTDRIIAAARAVRASRAAWDRDGALFETPAVHEPLVRALRAAAEAAGGQLGVVDFGGALGSTWWQHRAALAPYRVSWRVVERPVFVAAGREFSDEYLSFHDTLAAACAAGPGQVILLSSVLPYLAEPHAVLREVAGFRFPHVIADRTPLLAGERDRIVVQSPPPNLGGGRYPCWLFSRSRLVAHFAADYDLAAEWTVPFDEVDENVPYRGLHFQLRPPAAPSQP